MAWWLMQKYRLILLFVSLFAFLPAEIASSNASESLQLLQAHPLEITTQSGQNYQFAVRFALTAQQQKQGLMFVRHLPPMMGMVFVFSPPRKTRFWMRNTLIPLDMIFIAPDGIISKIVTRHDTQSDMTTSSDIPVAGVLEIAAGEALRLGISAGDVVSHRLIKF